MISISDLTVRVAGRLLIENASVSIPDGMKAGLVGRNGAGKLMLFRVLTGALAPTAIENSVGVSCVISDKATILTMPPIQAAV